VLGSNAGCDPKWGAQIALNDAGIMSQINAVKAAGGDIVVAFGGAAGPYLETSCSSQATLVTAYEKVIDTLGIKHLDIDIEASINVDMVNKALAQVQRERPGTTVSYTLMVQASNYGLTPALGVDVLKNAVANGVNVAIVNPMVMDFGQTQADWGDDVIMALQSTYNQMTTIWPSLSSAALHKKLGATPMIGKNDTGPVFSLADGTKLVNWANTNHIGSLGFWSVARDNGGCSGVVSPTCSGIAQSTYQFISIFRGFTG
jgi:chitinase